MYKSWGRKQMCFGVFTALYLSVFATPLAFGQTDQTDERASTQPLRQTQPIESVRPFGTDKYVGSEIIEETPEIIAPKNIVGTSVVLRTLDKITAITKDYTVKVGESLKFETLTVDVKHCEVKPPEAIPETFAFLQIFEPPRLSQKERAQLKETPEPIKLFSGWMLASKPAISALDHGVYDVWVIGCQGGDII